MDIPLNPNEYFHGYENEVSAEDFMSFIQHPFNRNRKFEFIDGRIVLMAGNASINHQTITGYIFGEIRNYLEGQMCEVFFDLNLLLYKKELGKCKNIYQPDIMINCDRSRKKSNHIEGVPEFVAEVISKSTGSYDYNEKRDNYIRYGVKELWLIDLLRDRITVCINKNISNPVTIKYTFSDEVSLDTFPDLTIDFKEILKKVDKSDLDWVK